jgi:hypothetical protein
MATSDWRTGSRHSLTPASEYKPAGKTTEDHDATTVATVFLALALQLIDSLRVACLGPHLRCDTFAVVRPCRNRSTPSQSGALSGCNLHSLVDSSPCLEIKF